MKKTILILLIIIIAGAVFYLVKDNKSAPEATQMSATPNITPASTDTVEIDIGGWKRYDGIEFYILYPAQAQLSEFEGNRDIKIVYLGPQQSESGGAQTEIFDGYSFTIARFLADERTTRELAAVEKDNAVKECINDGARVGELTGTSVSDAEAFRFDVDNCFGDYTITVFQREDLAYKVIQYYAGEPDDVAQYTRTSNAILSTLKFK